MIPIPPVLPVVPENITVHLGVPSSDAQNVTVPFRDYIKNVASSEIYPSWPEEAIRANILAQISFVLNRLYTNFYRAQGYDFDITNTTAFDQSFVYEREVFDNVSQIVDEIFNNYIARPGSVAPLFARYCNGTTSVCDGLSQWGSASLAEEGADFLTILRTYYGNDIEIRLADIVGEIDTLPFLPIALGSVGNAVRLLSIRLNRISANYPAIPKIYPTDGIFDTKVENAVKEFQRIFNLTPDGIVGRATWYRVQAIFNAVKRLSELASEDLKYGEVNRQFREELSPGDFGSGVDIIQYYLQLIGAFDTTIPSLPLDGYYGPETEAAVRAFQRTYGLPETGTVRPDTWEKLYDVYIADLSSVPESVFGNLARPFGGIVLREGSEEPDVLLLQEYLRAINSSLSLFTSPPLSGYFGPDTTAAVRAFQEYAGITPDGIVTPLTWDAIADTYNSIIGGYERNKGQYPGYDIGGEE